ncbi:107-domain-containing protein [Dunaliella salina]|uniref:Nuclear pore complex protein n=1 Tax=Dunaliella salina TaxID=3046 RepID=A0ABQ7G4K4_DUNSA|nr:107-domain-containing protein [Dunaliella salina]|eukprot:KAF5829538.1 107-domain-containing protein [Dunaliella salina]
MNMALHEGFVQHQPAASGSWDEEFATVLGELLLDRCDAKDATAALEEMAQRRSQLLKQDLSQQVHRPARFMHLQALAAELDAQAATWHLVWCLHCNEMPPAGTGGPEVLDTAGLRTTRQMLADHISSDAQLTRCAAVIAWLESMADDALNGATGTNRGLVTELDPDAPSRQGRSLHSDNAKAEDRLAYRLWQLVRSGRLKDARALCRACGQPWRAASIGGPGGDFGPLPVGLAAGQAINGDVLVHVVRSAVSSQGGFAAATALPGTGPADSATATVMSALTVLDGQWPAGVLPQASRGLVPPATFDALFAMLAASGVPSVVAAGRDNVHQVRFDAH